MNIFPFFVAKRYLIARRKGVFVSLVFMISIGGLILGTAATIITLSIMNGFQTDLRKKILGISAHIVLIGQEQKPFLANNALRTGILDIPEVLNISPFLYNQIILKSQTKSIGVILKGIKWDEEVKVTDLKSYIKKGDFSENKFSLKSQKELPAILIGLELARNLSIYIGDEVFIITSDNTESTMEVIPKITKCVVSGIFESGMYEYDSNLIFISLTNAQKIFNCGDDITGISIKIKDEFKAEKIASEIQNKSGYNYYVKSWAKMNKNLFSALKLEKLMMFIILTLITIVAAFNIASTLILLTIDKIKDIGILKAMGAKNKVIKNIFILQGAFIGIIGVVLGELLGVGLSLLVKKYKIIELPQDVYYISNLPVKIFYSDLILVGTVAFLISVFAALYPAISASKMSPVEAIKNE